MPIELVQKIVRGYMCRKHLQKQQDQMTFQLVSEMLEEHINHYRAVCRRNELLKNKKIRHTNFPSEISENIVKFVIFHKYKIMPTWDTATGDLQCGSLSIEVKAFSSIGPTSFGPTEKWDRIYFMDATQFIHSVFKVYECKIKNDNDIWQQLMVNKNETYGDHCKQRRRPRICFSNLYQQLGSNCQLIFDGHFNEKLCDVNMPYNHNISLTMMTTSMDDRKKLLQLSYRDIQKLVSEIRNRNGKTSPKPISKKKSDLLIFLYKYMNIS